MIGRVTVTGGQGFIGTHIVAGLVDAGVQVHSVDNLRTGRDEWRIPEVTYTHVDILDTNALLPAIDGTDWVVHLAGNPDARGERRGVNFDFEQNVQGTASVLAAMKAVGTTRILYASSASIYGNTDESPTPENFRSVPQASFYGASKIAAEGLIGAYCEADGFTGLPCRWVHILGERYLHGHIIDFLRKLRRDPTTLHILGDGNQAKSGLHAADLAQGLWMVMNHHDHEEGVCEPYNFGGDTLLPVKESARLIAEEVLGLHPTYTFSGRKNGGWVGDNANLVLDWNKVAKLGWKPTMTVPDAIRLTAEWLTGPECRYL